MRRRGTLAARSLTVVFALTAVTALAPPPLPTEAQMQLFYLYEHGQTLTIGADAAAPAVDRASYTATPGFEALANNGTNYDWAQLILLSGGWPISDNNVTVILRWMRQENGPPDWWNRNNPLNNGYGSGGGAGLGSYPNLVVAAQKVAANLKRLGGFAPIAAAFAASAPTTVTEHAIWASPWATGHYANGAHWSYAPVPVVKAPVGAW